MSFAGINRRHLLALCRKESYQIVRDPSSILIAFVLPIILLFIFGFGINLDTNKVRLGIVMEDSGAEANHFADVLKGSPFLDTEVSHSRAAMQKQLQLGKVRGFVILSSDFSARVRKHQEMAPIQLLTDGAEPNTANFLNSYLEGCLQVWQEQRRNDQGLPVAASTTLEPRY